MPYKGKTVLILFISNLFIKNYPVDLQQQKGPTSLAYRPIPTFQLNPRI